MVYEGLRVPKAHNPINPALNTVGVQCGDTVLISMRVEDTPQHNNNIVACLRHAESGSLSPPHTALPFVWG